MSSRRLHAAEGVHTNVVAGSSVVGVVPKRVLELSVSATSRNQEALCLDQLLIGAGSMRDAADMHQRPVACLHRRLVGAIRCWRTPTGLLLTVCIVIAIRPYG